MSRAALRLGLLAGLLAAGLVWGAAACKEKPDPAVTPADLTEQRLKLVYNRLAVLGVGGPVLDALAVFPRHELLPVGEWYRAYQDGRISLPGAVPAWAPSTTAPLLQLLAPGPGQKILLAGVQEGWVAGVLDYLGADVTVWDPSDELREQAEDLLNNIELQNYDPKRIRLLDSLDEGLAGGPYERIFVMGALPRLESKWMSALAPEGAVMVAPVGLPGLMDVLLVQTSGGRAQVRPYTQGEFEYFMPQLTLNYAPWFLRAKEARK